MKRNSIHKGKAHFKYIEIFEQTSSINFVSHCQVSWFSVIQILSLFTVILNIFSLFWLNLSKL